MRVQVKKGGVVSLPRQAMAVLGIKEQDFLEWRFMQSGILFTPIALAESMAGPKKNGDTNRVFRQIQYLSEWALPCNEKQKGGGDARLSVL